MNPLTYQDFELIHDHNRRYFYTMIYFAIITQGLLPTLSIFAVFLSSNRSIFGEEKN
jgi:hypothetical protein